MPANIEIEYFGVYGRAECTKMMLAYLGVPFTDVNITNWAEVKGDTEKYAFGCMPVVVADGMRFGQTRSQMRMLATCAGIYNPADPKGAYAADNLMDQWDGVLCAKGLEGMTAALDTLLRIADKQMSNNKWSYVAGNKAGPADFCVSHFMLNMVRAGDKVDAEKKAAF